MSKKLMGPTMFDIWDACCMVMILVGMIVARMLADVSLFKVPNQTHIPEKSCAINNARPQ